MGDYVLSK